MLNSYFYLFLVLSLLIAAVCFMMFFVSLFTSKTPAILAILSAINIFFSSYLSIASFNVVQLTTNADGTIMYTTLNTSQFDPIFFSWLMQLVYWFSIIMFLVGVFFTVIAMVDFRRKRRIPKWKKRLYAQRGIEL